MDYAKARKEMVRLQLQDRGIRDGRLLEAMGRVAREDFLDPHSQSLAYIDSPLEIASGQTISQPFMLARLLEELQPQGNEKVLEIGTGSGYSTAILALLSARVVSIERDRTLYEKAQQNLARFKEKEEELVDIRLIESDGSKGYPGSFQAIVVHASAPKIPDSLLYALAPGGRMVIPIKNAEGEYLHLIEKESSGNVLDHTLDACRFVPLLGEEAF